MIAMLDPLIRFVGHLGRWGYLVIFLGVTLESAAFLGFIIPGVWGVGIVLIGYLVGASWRVVGHWIGAAAGIIVGMLVLVIVLALL